MTTEQESFEETERQERLTRKITSITFKVSPLMKSDLQRRSVEMGFQNLTDFIEFIINEFDINSNIERKLKDTLSKFDQAVAENIQLKAKLSEYDSKLASLRFYEENAFLLSALAKYKGRSVVVRDKQGIKTNITINTVKDVFHVLTLNSSF